MTDAILQLPHEGDTTMTHEEELELITALTDEAELFKRLIMLDDSILPRVSAVIQRRLRGVHHHADLPLPLALRAISRELDGLSVGLAGLLALTAEDNRYILRLLGVYHEAP